MYCVGASAIDVTRRHGLKVENLGVSPHRYRFCQSAVIERLNKFAMDVYSHYVRALACVVKREHTTNVS